MLWSHARGRAARAGAREGRWECAGAPGEARGAARWRGAAGVVRGATGV
jgi:hypothetical protein